MTTSQAAEHAELIPGRWYWVSEADGSWHPALHNPMSAGGWTNEDTWEDFDGAIIQWRLIPLPSDHDARAALAQPEPLGVTHEALTQFAVEWWASFTYAESDPDTATPISEIIHSWHFVDFLEDALARWGRVAIAPIPVSERLPGAEDCDAEGRCWFWEPDCSYNGLKWALVDRTYGCNAQESAFTHWLPFHALPLPGQPAPDA
jgi:hypothetical protein